MKNNYWALRAENERKWQLKQLQKDSRFNKVLDRSYQIAIDNINKQIEHELNRVGGIRNLVTADQMAEYERLARQVVNRANIMRAQGKKVIKYSDFPQEINDRLRVYNATMRINQLELIKSEIGTHLLDLGMDIETKITDKVNADYFAEMKRQAGILRSTVSNNIWTSPAVIDRATANITVGAFSKNIWANIDNLKARLDGLVATAMVRGDNPKEMIKYLKPMVKKTVGDATYAAERIARTESSRVQHEAQVLSLKQNDYKYCKWYIEPGACKYCREIAHSNSGGNLPEGIYEVDDCPDIPVHPNCRCSIGAYWLDEESVKQSGAIRKDMEHVQNFEALTDKENKAKKIYLELGQRDASFAGKIIAKVGNISDIEGKQVFNHIFRNKHKFDDEISGEIYEDYFDPDYDMAQSFLRILNRQKVLERDIILIKHELLESNLMKENPDLTYKEAHKITNQQFNYENMLEGK